VQEADSGHAAIDATAREPAIDLVLIDIAMPEINGVEAIETIVRKRPNLRFLYMTGYVGPTPLDAQERRVLKKPFTIGDLAAKLEEILFPRQEFGRGSNVVPMMSTARK